MLIGLTLLAIVVILTGTLLFEAVFYTEEQQFRSPSEYTYKNSTDERKIIKSFSFPKKELF